MKTGEHGKQLLSLSICGVCHKPIQEGETRSKLLMWKKTELLKVKLLPKRREVFKKRVLLAWRIEAGFQVGLECMK